MKKYFIAIVPKGEVSEKANEIKMALKERFGLKYAMKSPPHITLKMPFSYNEQKEQELIKKLNRFFEGEKKFVVGFKGYQHFGNRVIFAKVKYPPALVQLQTKLTEFCKARLGQPMELSDSHFQPHMTLAFKDLKKNQFEEYWTFIQQFQFNFKAGVEEIALLKKENFKWIIVCNFNFEGD